VGKVADGEDAKPVQLLGGAFPTHIASTGKGANATARRAASVSPSGFAARDATLATNLVGPIPTNG
jgi:hypothetical protein